MPTIGRVCIHGRCRPDKSSQHMLKLVKDATMCLLGFEKEDKFDYHVLLHFSNPDLTPGFFGCEAEVTSHTYFDVKAYAARLEKWLNDQITSACGSEGINVSVMDPEDVASSDAAAAVQEEKAPVLKSEFKPGKCIHVVSHVHSEREYSHELEADLKILIQAFMESESKGSYDTLYGSLVRDYSRMGKHLSSWHLFVAAKSLGGSDEACGQRLWALCRRLEEWLNVQLFAKYPEYERTVCVPMRNELKPSVL
uniref:E4 ORF4 n=1 Tax=Bat mastadenovirus TaxID=740971 RepID=A0A8G0VZR2_9ADEN|nr:E4 ORF4 [Bat mastadenovirus]